MNLFLKDTDYEYYKSAVNSIVSADKLRAAVVTFGCQQNEADAEVIRGIAQDMGYSLTDSVECADLIVVNTCAIRAHAEEKALSFIGTLKRIKRQNPSLIVCVAGCMAAEKGTAEILKNNFHFVSFIIPPNALHEIPARVYTSLVDKKRNFAQILDKGNIVEGLPRVRTEGCRAWVSVMYGCNNFCSYCIVPYVRGRERSRDPHVIIEECRELAASGIKEITLLGQNVNSYKSNLDFPSLLEEIAKIEGDFIIRFMTSHPKDVSDDLIRIMGKYSPKIAPYFHLPLQSGSDRILAKMNRTYTRERFMSIAKRLRESVPNICLSTDVIVGFPTETDADFADTLSVLRQVEFDMVFGFIYSPREGTPAAKMEGAVDDAVKHKRLSELLLMQDGIALPKNEVYVGKRVRVLCEGYSKKSGENNMVGRTDTNKTVHFSSNDKNIVGKFLEVEITKASVCDLIGKEIKEI